MSIGAAIVFVIIKSILFSIVRFFGFAPEIPSPKARTGWKGFTYDEEKGTLTIHNLFKGYAVSVQNTNSMDGLLDESHIVFMSKDFTIDDVEVGEVVFYRKDRNANLHQIVYAGKNKSFFITQGLNCHFPDPFAIHYDDIVSVMRVLAL